MTVTQDELWALVAGRRQGVLATVSSDSSPQLSNVLYVADADTRVVRISTTAGRAKARNVTRHPRAALHVAGDDFWQYAVAHGTVEASDVASTPGDPATDELFAVHSHFYGTLDRTAFDEEMIHNHRLVLRLHVSRLTGVITSRGRRPSGHGPMLMR
jgi:PPOX class probable F420-dependent enzyme